MNLEIKKNLSVQGRNIKGTDKNKAFTLVELIVVIVILAILSTIAFLSFSSQSASARDSTRLSDMSNIAKGLSVFNASAGKYPKPDSSVSITASGDAIGYQGYAGENVLGLAKLSTGGKDPLDSLTFYTYNINVSQTKFQISGFLENGNNPAFSMSPSLFDNKASADPSSYSGRYIHSRGDQLGVLLTNHTQVPVQADNSIYGTSLELKDFTGSELMAYVGKNEILISSGVMMGGLGGYYTTSSASSRYPGCNAQDIRLSNGQIWAACNVGADVAYDRTEQNLTLLDSGSSGGPTQAQKSYMGGYFQWGRNDDVTIAPITTALATGGTSAGMIGHGNFIKNPSNATYFDWINIQNADLWGGSGTTNSIGTYITQGKPASMQGPCSNGYHIPTQSEWRSAMSAINPTINIGSAQNDTSVATILKLPLSGMRYAADAAYYAQGSFGFYWSSSPTGNYSYNFAIDNTLAPSVSGNNIRGSALSVRCLKN